MENAAALERRTTPSARLLAVPAVIAVLLAGVWLLGSLDAGYFGRIALTAGWLVVASVGLGVATRRRRDLRFAVRVTAIATSLAIGALFAWTTFRDTTVNERVATGVAASAAPAPAAARTPATNVQLAAGRFEDVDQSRTGRAAVVRLASGRQVLTLRDLDVANGPDLRVYLVTGDGRHLGSHRDLGALKGNRGNQQYAIPEHTDVSRFATVVIYCRAFTEPFVQAHLTPS
jgi:hypothetical protein